MPRKSQTKKRWTPFDEIMVDSFLESMRAKGMKMSGPFDVPRHIYTNSIYQVAVHIYPANTWPEFPHEVTQLSIKRHDKREVKDWRDFQRIKTEILGPEVEGVDLFPSESRLLDTANQYHIWCLPRGIQFPFGYFDGRIVSDSSCGGGLEPTGSRQRPLPENMAPTTTPEKITAAIAGRVKCIYCGDYGYCEECGVDHVDA